MATADATCSCRLPLLLLPQHGALCVRRHVDLLCQLQLLLCRHSVRKQTGSLSVSLLPLLAGSARQLRRRRHQPDKPPPCWVWRLPGMSGEGTTRASVSQLNVCNWPRASLQALNPQSGPTGPTACSMRRQRGGSGDPPPRPGQAAGRLIGRWESSLRHQTLSLPNSSGRSPSALVTQRAGHAGGVAAARGTAPGVYHPAPDPPQGARRGVCGGAERPALGAASAGAQGKGFAVGVPDLAFAGPRPPSCRRPPPAPPCRCCHKRARGMTKPLGSSCCC